MEVKTAFAIIIGIIMMVTVVLAVVVMMGGLSNIMVSECVPISYAAGSFGGEYCGVNAANQQLSCNYVDASSARLYDKCFDSIKNMCCPTETGETLNWRVQVINGQCCNITRT